MKAVRTPEGSEGEEWVNENRETWGGAGGSGHSTERFSP